MSFDFSSSKQFLDAVILKPASPDVATHPLISVVTACFNPLKDGRKDLFLKSLDSAQQQIGVSLEHIIVDGASTDGTLEFLQAYDNNNHDIRILSMPDSGIYEAMNRGIALSRGKYVIFLNTDDFYHRTDGLLLCAEALDKYKWSNSKYVTVSIESYTLSDSKRKTVNLSFVYENGNWFLDSPTYKKKK